MHCFELQYASRSLNRFRIRFVRTVTFLYFKNDLLESCSAAFLVNFLVANCLDFIRSCYMFVCYCPNTFVKIIANTNKNMTSNIRHYNVFLFCF